VERRSSRRSRSRYTKHSTAASSKHRTAAEAGASHGCQQVKQSDNNTSVGKHTASLHASIVAAGGIPQLFKQLRQAAVVACILLH
jgi:hypothetical protein